MSAPSNEKLFGKALRMVQFSHHGHDLCRVNNGSFGSCPAVVLAAQHQLQAEWLRNPDDFWHTLDERFSGMQEAIARDLFEGRVRSEDIAVVDNLTVAVSVIIHSIVSNIKAPNSVIVISTLTYNAVKNAVAYGVSQARKKNDINISILTVDIPFPLIAEDPDEAILTAYRKALSSIPSESIISLACLDHIASLPCLRCPVKDLVAMMREFGAKEVLIDGAHGPGQLDVADEVPDMGADYYVANLHKWLFMPAAAAFLWCSPNAPSRSCLHHPIISHSYTPSPLHDNDFVLPAECAMLGTRDYSPMLVVPAALAFAKSLGGIAAIRARNALLCSQAASLLCLAWNTSTSPRDPDTAPMHFPTPPPLGSPLSSFSSNLTHKNTLRVDQGLSMAMVGCPSVLGDSFDEGEELRLRLREMNIVIQKCVPVPGDRLYLRISCAVYNHFAEYELLRDAVLLLAAKKAGEKDIDVEKHRISDNSSSCS